jgi:Transposase DNA-binding/Transposase DDE domain
MVRSVKAVRGSVVPEFVGARLGDERRGERLVRVARRLEKDPRSSFPQSMRTTGELEAFYRFVNNDDFTAAQLLQPHKKATFERAEQSGMVLVVHDTTHVEFPGDAKREGLGVTSAKHQGFIAHCSLMLSADASVPLGVSQMETYTRTGQKWALTRKTRTRVRDDPSRESLRWWRAVEAIEQEREGKFESIHVMDAEADFFELLSQMVSSGTRFIVRAGQLDRTIELAERAMKLRDFVDHLPVIATRLVRLSARRYLGRRQPAATKKRYPAREERDATLAIGAGSLALRKTRYSRLGCPDVRVNVLRIWEPNPPRDAPPVEWILLTSEPIDSPHEVIRIVDWYRQRWVIEDFFKALKTGCSLEIRQLESYRALVKVTAILLPIAYRLLLLRSLERGHPDSKPTAFFSQIELELMLLDDSTRGLPKPKTLADAMRLLARMGGHLKNNGPPGWLTLARGYQHLLTLLAGWHLAHASGFSRERCDQS